MADTTGKSLPPDPLAEYVAGRLSPAEQRQLAQAALDDEALFDALTVHGAMEQGLRENPEFRRAVAEQKPVAFPARWWKPALVGAAAAALAVGAYYWTRSAAPVPTVARQTPSAEPPALLARDLPRSGAPVFRGDGTESRLPRAEGSVVSVDDGVVNVDLGALDGVAKTTELQVMHGGRTVGQLAVTTVFRGRSRARVSGGVQIQAHDVVKVPDAVYQAAMLQQLEALASRGEASGALDLVRKSPRLAESAPIAALCNDLGAFFLRTHDSERAEAALTLAAGNAAVRPRAANNLGALYDGRGDRARAAQFYREALGAASTEALGADSKEDRTVITRNLERAERAR
jgi:hypothetical protein